MMITKYLNANDINCIFQEQMQDFSYAHKNTLNQRKNPFKEAKSEGHQK